MKRKSRMAWGLSGLLALVLVGGLAAFASYGQQKGAFTVEWSPISSWRSWSVGKSAVVFSGWGVIPVDELLGERYSLGFVSLYVLNHK